MSNTPKMRIRMLCFALSVLLLIPLVQTTLAAPAETDFISTVPVYHSPSADSTVIGQVADGMSVKAVGYTDGFFKVDCDPMIGYLPESNLRFAPTVGYVVTCGPENTDSGTLPQYIPLDAFALRASLIELGNRFLGTPYVYGGSSPRGFDCSGFVYYVFGKHDIALHRCADEQMQDGLVVAREDLQAGDLVFFRVYGPWVASHVGIYVGNNQMIHAASGGISYASLDAEYWASSYVGARRLIPINTTWADSQNKEPMNSSNDIRKIDLVC